MKRILIIHEDSFFAEFIAQYFNAAGFKALCKFNNVEGYTEASKNIPDLIIANKESPFLDLKGFLIKKGLIEKLAVIPLFLIGDFLPAEIKEYKKYNVMAFLSKRLNPKALLERVHFHFNIPLPDAEQHTPMMLDLHSKGNIFIAQIEGNFDPVNLVMLNFLIRVFFKAKKIKKPHIMFIIPSIYDESITENNIDFLFSFTGFREMLIDPKKIQILTRIQTIRDIVETNQKYNKFIFARDYVDAFKELMTDVNLETVVPLDYMKKGNVYSLDLYDKDGHVIVPAMTEVTQELINSLKARGLTKMKYYSDIDITKIGIVSGINLNAAIFDYITREFTPISTESFDMNILNQKQNLFFSRVKGQNILFITDDGELKELGKYALSSYFTINYNSDGNGIDGILDENRMSVVFIDLRIDDQKVITVMKQIREKATRRQTSIILLAYKINKAQLLNYMNYGTDHVILFPFSTTKLYNKVYTAVITDRGN